MFYDSNKNISQISLIPLIINEILIYLVNQSGLPIKYKLIIDNLSVVLFKINCFELATRIY